jgi:hypothetical protein
MMGVLDETRTVEYGEVFVQYSNNRLSSLPSKRCQVDIYSSMSLNH